MQGSLGTMTNAMATEPLRIKDWLGHEDNRLLPEASFYYRAWLDATKDIASVKKPLGEWLSLNGSADDIDHVCRAWLRAGGSFSFVRKPVLEWVMTHSLERDAVFILKYVVRQRVLPDDVTLKILAWCSHFATDPDAIWRLSSLTAHVSFDLSVEALRAAVVVLEPIFESPQPSGLTRSQVTAVLGNLSRLDPLRSEPMSHELDSLFVRWIRHPESFEPSVRHGPHHQTRHFLARLVEAAEAETEAPPDVSSLMAWVDTWDERTRVECKDLIKRLRKVRHLSGVWKQRRH